MSGLREARPKLDVAWRAADAGEGDAAQEELRKIQRGGPDAAALPAAAVAEA